MMPACAIVSLSIVDTGQDSHGRYFERIGSSEVVLHPAQATIWQAPDAGR